MKKKKSCYKGSKIKQLIKNFIAKHKSLCIAFLLCALVGIVVGIITACKNSSLIEILDLKDRALLLSLQDESSCFSLFFSRIIDITFWFLALILLNAFSFLNWLSYVVIFYKGFFIGINIAILCITTGLISKLLVLLILFPLWLIILVCFCVLCIVCIIRSKQAKKYGDGYFISCKGKFPVKFVLFLYAICVLVVLLECVVINIINVTFIIVV